MGGGSTTPSLTALLCLGLCWRPWDQVQAGVLPKPSIQADPGPIVPKGSPVTLWCQGSPQAEVYRLYKVGDSGLWEDEATQDSRNTARFHFESLSSRHAGQYQCAYRSMKGWSRQSDPLALVVTGPADTIHPSQNHTDPRNASPPEDYTVGNIIRMAVAGLILLGLGILLFQA